MPQELGKLQVPHQTNLSWMMALLNWVPSLQWEAALVFITRQLYSLATLGYSDPSVKPQPRPDSIRIVAISDTHSAQGELEPLPSGDVLIHAGDLTEVGSAEEVDAALGWLAAQTHQYKIYIAGNHDGALQDPKWQIVFKARYPELIYLQDSTTVVNVRGRELRIYGHAQVPAHLGYKAFTYTRIPPWFAHSTHFDESVQGEIWGRVPEYVDVTVTHGPPRGICDAGTGDGCAGLRRALKRVRPVLHLCGHLHEGRGVRRVKWDETQDAAERVEDGVGTWRDAGTVAWGVARRMKEAVDEWVWSWSWSWIGGELASGWVRPGETIVANVASKTKGGKGPLRGAEVFDI